MSHPLTNFLQATSSRRDRNQAEIEIKNLAKQINISNLEFENNLKNYLQNKINEKEIHRSSKALLSKARSMNYKRSIQSQLTTKQTLLESQVDSNSKGANIDGMTIFKSLKKMLKQVRKTANREKLSESIIESVRLDTKEPLIIGAGPVTSRKDIEIEGKLCETLNHYSNFSKRALTKVTKVYDSLSDEEFVESESSKQKSIMTQDSSSYIILSTLQIVYLLSFYLIFPYIFAYFTTTASYPNKVLLAYEMLGEFNLFFQVIFSFWTKFRHFKSCSSLSPSDYKLYSDFKFEFFFDLLIFFPFSIVFSYSFWTNLFRIFKFIGIFKLWTQIDEYLFDTLKIGRQENFKKVTLIKFAFYFLAILNFFSCIWISIGLAQRENVGWIGRLKEPDNQFSIYATSIYFNMATIMTVGYGDVTALTIPEKVYISVFLIFSNLFYSFIVTSISKVVYNMSQKDEHFKFQSTMLDSISKEYSLHDTLKKKISKHHRAMERYYLADKDLVLNCLPEKLKNEVCSRMFCAQINGIKFFENVSESFVFSCISKVKVINMLSNEILLSIGDSFSEMYIVSNGCLKLYLGPQYNNYYIAKIKRFQHYGDVNMYLNERSEVMFKSGFMSEILSLSKESYSELKNRHPEEMENIMANSIVNYDLLENLVKRAANYYDTYKFFDGFKLQVNIERVESTQNLVDYQMNTHKLMSPSKNNLCISSLSKKEECKMSFKNLGKLRIKEASSWNSMSKYESFKLDACQSSSPIDSYSKLKSRACKLYSEDIKSRCLKAKNLEDKKSASSKIKFIQSRKDYKENYCNVSLHLVFYSPQEKWLDITYLEVENRDKVSTLKKDHGQIISNKFSPVFQRKSNIKQSDILYNNSKDDYFKESSSSFTQRVEIGRPKIYASNDSKKLTEKSKAYKSEKKYILEVKKSDSNKILTSIDPGKSTYENIITPSMKKAEKLKILNQEVEKHAYYDSNISKYEGFLKSYLLNNKCTNLKESKPRKSRIKNKTFEP